MKVLIFDDNPLTKQLLASEFQREADQLVEAADLEKALQQYYEFKPDLFVINADLSDEVGFEACARVRGLSASKVNFNDNQTPIIFLTNNDTYEARKKGFEVGATDFVTRPYITSELKSLAFRLTDKQRPKSLQGVTVLIAEDNDATLKLLDRILRSEGIVPILARNGQEAWDILRERQSEIDLLLADYLMPELDGLSLCRKIRQEMPKLALPIIFLSGISEMDSVVELFKAGASDYIPKPFTKEELLARFKVHLEAKALRKKLEQQVEELEKLNQVKNKVIAITSHDLRSPLNGIMGLTSLLKDAENLNETQQEWLTMIYHSGEILLSLIHDLLVLGDIYTEDSQDQVEVELNQSLSMLVENMRTMAAAKDIRMMYKSFSATPVLARVHLNSLVRLCNNLLSNAVKFTPAGGMVKLELAGVEEGRMKIVVQDTGIGFKPEVLSKIFTEFGSYSRPGTVGEPSTGLGLSIVVELVERLGGEISVKSTPNEGSQFTILLPMG